MKELSSVSNAQRDSEIGTITHDMMELLGLVFPAGARVYNRVALWIIACGFL
jgi:hypothetical protein